MHRDSHCLQLAYLKQDTSSIAAMCADLRPVALARYGQPDKGLNVTDVLASTTFFSADY